ncbi:MAG TPA: DUF58 domain-containing protein [Acidobacteriota bacterium]|nr:DUF58 domain-containing protein [Acidobacteriota bacterium]
MASFRFKILTRNPELGIRASGLKFAFIFVVVLFAAVNTGNNLTYLIFSALLGGVVISWSTAYLSLRAIEVNLKFPEEIYAGEETRVDFIIHKGPGLLPGRSLGFGFRPVPPNEAAHQPYLSQLERGETRRLQGNYFFKRRGRFRIDGVDVRCNYPFGLISLGKHYPQPKEILVYPKIVKLEEMLERRSVGALMRDSPRRGHDGGLLNVRPFLPGDDYRRLHWKASAKLERMMLKEFSQEEGEAIWLHFNPLRRGDKRRDDDRIFELGVSMAASIAYLGRQSGLRMLFSAPDLRLVPGEPADHTRQFLDYLAEVRIGPRALSSDVLRVPEHRSEEAVIVVDPLNTGADWGRAEVYDRGNLEKIFSGGRTGR